MQIAMDDILNEIRSLNEDYPQGLIAIGGVAVYLHAQNDGRGTFAETTHDIDFYLSQEHLSTLRDKEEMTPNPKLRKQQIIKNQIEMDIYVEHQHGLSIPYIDIERHSTTINGIRVASKEHLLILKLDAAMDRAGSGKGRKDAKDIINIVVSLQKPKANLLNVAMDDRRLSFLRAIGKSTEGFKTMTGGNAHQASIMRNAFNKNVDTIQTLYQQAIAPSPQEKTRKTKNGERER